MPLAPECHKMLVWTLSIGKQKFLFLYTCSLLLRNTETGRKQRHQDVDHLASCSLTVQDSHAGIACRIEAAAQQSALLTFQPQTVKEGMTLQKTLCKSKTFLK